MSDVIVTCEGRVGRIRLNRSSALHALTTDMCSAILDALAEFEGREDVGFVVIDHVSGRGFCAGGDIRMLAESGQGDGHAARDFFLNEYRMNHRLFTYAHPTIAVMDGITMGGGVGLALPCRYRIATENTRFAMPETGIGLFPDVGGGWYLPRLPGKVGTFLALTGARLDGAECVSLGLATHYIPAERVPAVLSKLHDCPDIGELLDAHAAPLPQARVLENRVTIDTLFVGDTVERIMADLAQDGGEWAAKELATLRSKSPLSMKVALRQLREGLGMASFEEEMRQEYAIGSRMVHSHDFIEGVRALIVDKDNAPRWDPPTPEGVKDVMVDAIFAPLPANEQWTPLVPNASPRA